jgi:3-oxoacyl-[acyl-carrier-protein] synthase II
MGVVSPLGIGLEDNWLALCAGKSGIGPVTGFDTTGFRTRIAGEVTGFNPEDFMSRKLVRRSNGYIHFALAATRMAVEDAGITITGEMAPRVGTAVGTAMGGVKSLEHNHSLLLTGAKNQMSPFFIPSFICNMAAGQVAIEFNAAGPNMCSVTACASGTHSIGDAFRAIQMDEADVMLAGGSESAISPVVFAGLDVIKVMSARNEDPEKASRPFDQERDGFIMSEGAAMVVIEELEFALNRGARIYTEVLGYGHNSDAYHITSPDPEGQGAARCMQLAMDDADVSPDAIDYINAHGTSTAINDISETKAIKKAFGERAYRIPVSSNKSMTGHLWAGAGALEAIFSAMTIVEGIIPPTINYESPDPECDLDYVPNTLRKADVQLVLSNSFGFGSTNGTLILGKYRA